MSSIYQALQTLLYSGKGVGVLFCGSVKVAEVNTEPQAAIFLPYQYHCIAPHTLAWPDSTRLQHLPQVVLNLLNQWWENLPKLLFKWRVISHMYYVFDGVGTAQFSGVQWKTPWYLARSQWVASASSGAKNPTDSNQFHWIISHAFAWQSIWGYKDLGTHHPSPVTEPLGWFGYWKHCYCPGHQGFLLEGLWGSHTVPYHHDCLFTSLPQLRVCVLYSEALQQRAIFSP